MGRVPFRPRTGDCMRSIRKVAYAAVLGVSIFTIQPTLAAAEDARGVFTLSHEVHWQNSVLGAGDYAFSLKEAGRPTFLMIRGIHGTGRSEEHTSELQS